MNLFENLFYSQWVTPALYPMPVSHWLFFSEALVTFPLVEALSGYPHSSRRTKKVQAIILHHTGSLEFAKALKWFGNPNNYTSTHYLVDLDGFIQLLVPEDMAALHTPNAVYKHSRLVNESSIGISLIGNGVNQFTQEQYEAVALLCAYLQKKYGLNKEDILKHSEVETTNSAAPANDPAPWDKNKFNELLDKFLNL
jgi:N-acetyl-anhydromuramyl-L-alanine amidase AmpD